MSYPTPQELSPQEMIDPRHKEDVHILVRLAFLSCVLPGWKEVAIVVDRRWSMVCGPSSMLVDLIRV